MPQPKTHFATPYTWKPRFRFHPALPKPYTAPPAKQGRLTVAAKAVKAPAPHPLAKGKTVSPSPAMQWGEDAGCRMQDATALPILPPPRYIEPLRPTANFDFQSMLVASPAPRCIVECSRSNKLCQSSLSTLLLFPFPLLLVACICYRRVKPCAMQLRRSYTGGEYQW